MNSIWALLQTFTIYDTIWRKDTMKEGGPMPMMIDLIIIGLLNGCQRVPSYYYSLQQLKAISQLLSPASRSQLKQEKIWVLSQEFAEFVLKYYSYDLSIIFNSFANSMSSHSEPPQINIPERLRKDASLLKQSFLQIMEEEVKQCDPTERARMKTLFVQYLNLILKEQRDYCHYYEDESPTALRTTASSPEDELLEQKCQLMDRVLTKKTEQCKTTKPTSMNLDIDISKPESLFVMRKGVEVPIENELAFHTIEANPQKIQHVHDQQNHFCAAYREMLSHQKWLSERKP